VRDFDDDMPRRRRIVSVEPAYAAYGADDPDDSADDDLPVHAPGRRGVRLWQGVPLALLAGVCGLVVLNAAAWQPGPHPAPLGGTVVPRDVVMPQPRPSTAPGITSAANPAAPLATAAIPARPPAAPRPRPETVTAVQRELFARGFYDGAVDGVAGPRTEAAIKDFEIAAGLRPTGEPTDEVLLAVMRSDLRHPVTVPAVVVPMPQRRPDMPRVEPVRAEGPRADAVPPARAETPARPAELPRADTPEQRRIIAVQRALSEYGYGNIRANGVLGPETRAAIERFERDRRLPPTGQPSDRVVREIATVTGRVIE
jgi:peptidoglycan hydrolase-like protein with peptidoglycan-binding domain